MAHLTRIFWTLEHAVEWFKDVDVQTRCYCEKKSCKYCILQRTCILTTIGVFSGKIDLENAFQEELNKIKCSYTVYQPYYEDGEYYGLDNNYHGYCDTILHPVEDLIHDAIESLRRNMLLIDTTDDIQYTIVYDCITTKEEFRDFLHHQFVLTPKTIKEPIFKDELMARTWHPDRVIDWCDKDAFNLDAE